MKGYFNVSDTNKDTPYTACPFPLPSFRLLLTTDKSGMAAKKNRLLPKNINKLTPTSHNQQNQPHESIIPLILPFLDQLDSAAFFRRPVRGFDGINVALQTEVEVGEWWNSARTRLVQWGELTRKMAVGWFGLGCVVVFCRVETRGRNVCREKKKRRRRKKGNGREESAGGLWFARAGDRGGFFFGVSAWSVVIVCILKKSGAFVIVAAAKTSVQDMLLSFFFSSPLFLPQ